MAQILYIFNFIHVLLFALDIWWVNMNLMAK